MYTTLTMLGKLSVHAWSQCGDLNEKKSINWFIESLTYVDSSSHAKMYYFKCKSTLIYKIWT